jgi:hypothetical protein
LYDLVPQNNVKLTIHNNTTFHNINGDNEFSAHGALLWNSCLGVSFLYQIYISVLCSSIVLPVWVVIAVISALIRIMSSLQSIITQIKKRALRKTKGLLEWSIMLLIFDIFYCIFNITITCPWNQATTVLNK